MAEHPKPLGEPPPRPTAPQAGGGRGAPHNDAFDAWLHGVLLHLFGDVANEPVPEALRRLAAGDTPPERRAGGAAERAADPPPRARSAR